MTKVLIGTANLGKLKEIKAFFADLNYEFYTLDDMPHQVPDPEETEPTLTGNAILKAKYYAKAYNMITIADDGGLFIDALDGWPGVKSARVAKTMDERMALLRKELKDVKEEDRTASFKTDLCCYDPFRNTTFIASGSVRGTVVPPKEGKDVNNWGYNHVFYMDSVGKTYSEMSLQEKNSHSHRGKALLKIKYYLMNNYGHKDIVVPIALIVKDGKFLIQKRNDPHRPKFHGKWEFPGGGIDSQETMEEALVREVREETGYTVKVSSRIEYIHQAGGSSPSSSYRVFIFPHLCEIESGVETLSELEALELRWVTLEEAYKLDLLGDNEKLLRNIEGEFKKFLNK